MTKNQVLKNLCCKSQSLCAGAMKECRSKQDNTEGGTFSRMATVE